MLSREALVSWVGVRYGWRHAEARITDRGFAYLVNTQPDAYLDGDQSAMTYGNGPDVVLKGSGEVWRLGSNPVLQPVYKARNEKQFWRALRKVGMSADHPAEWVVPPFVLPPPAPREVTHAAVAEWLRRHGQRHIDRRIDDRGWAFVIDNQPNAYLEGDQSAMAVGGGPLIIVKRTGGIWYLPSLPQYWPAYDAGSEENFYTTMRPFGIDPSRPSDRFPDAPHEVSRERVVDWVRTTYGFAHLEDRVNDIGFAFTVNTQPDAYLDGDESAMTFGNGPTYVIKSTGAVWMLGSNPMMLPVFDATTEAAFYEAFGADPAKPHDWIRG